MKLISVYCTCENMHIIISYTSLFYIQPQCVSGKSNTSESANNVLSIAI